MCRATSSAKASRCRRPEEFRKAAEAGFGFAEIRYGVRLREGLGGPVDPAKAEALFKSAQAKGLPARRWLARPPLSQRRGRKSAIRPARHSRSPGRAPTGVTPRRRSGRPRSSWRAVTFERGHGRRPRLLQDSHAEADEGDVSYRAATFIEDTERRIAERKAAETPVPAAPAAPN